MAKFGQRCVDYLVRRPALTLSSLAFLCLMMVVWQGTNATRDAHRHAALTTAAYQARTFENLLRILNQQSARGDASSGVRTAAGSSTSLRILSTLATRLNKRDAATGHHSHIRIVSSHSGSGLPVAAGHFELSAIRQFLRGRRSAISQVVAGKNGDILYYATPVPLARFKGGVRTVTSDRPPLAVMQVSVTPLPGWVDGLAHTLNLPLLLLICSVSIGFCMVVFLVRRLKGLLAEGKSLAMLAVQHNEELQTAVNGAHNANQAKSDFLAKMSHELRTPLNAIIGFSDIIRSPYGDRMTPEKRREYAHDIHASGTHLLSVINEILDISRIEAGRFELEEERFQLLELVQSTVRIVYEQAENAGLNLDVRVAEDPPDIWADLRALRQVLINLLANAIKFTDAGGVVSLMAWFDDGGRLVINVSDSGMGIAPGDLDKVLKPFEQVEGAMSRKNYGTGLGLPIAKNIVEQHGGLLNLDSELHRGTTVTIMLPVERIYWPETPATAPAPTALLDAETGQTLAFAEVPS